MSDASDTSDTDELGENVITERLTIIATMVAGDFSSVVAARRQSDNRIYCVKAFRRDMMPAPDLNETDTPLAFRVLRELRGNQTASQLPHPFISQSLFAFKSEQHLLLGMDRAGADDFFTYLMTRGTIDEASARFYTVELCLALAHIHSIDLINRDVKPENIIICVDGHIKLIDFGSCMKLSGRVGDQPPPPRLCSLAGTPEYIAPEVWRSNPICVSVDWWSLGCLTYEMLIGHSPFVRADDSDVLQLCARIVVTQDIASMADHPFMPTTAFPLIQALLNRNPFDRLGARPHGYQAILQHEWFDEVNVQDALRKELEPPWLPSPFVGAEQAAVWQGEFTTGTHAGGQVLVDTFPWPEWPHATEQDLNHSADWGDAVAFAEFGV